MQWRSTAAWAAVFALLVASTAHAFSDPFAYTDAPEFGGGGGRWYTGSRADGYACDSCHSGGEPADLNVIGLPRDGYVSGQAYEVIVQWPIAIENLALIAEFTNDQDVTSGLMALPRLDAMQPAERCGVEFGGYPAAELHDTDEGRQLLSVIDCGAAATRFLWTAPMTADEDVWFNLGFVSSDGDGDATGDGVTLVAQPIPSQREGDRGSYAIVESACSVSLSGRTASTSAVWMLLALALARVLDKRARQWS